MELQAFREEEVAKIYKNKVLYSMIKYSEQSKIYQHDPDNITKFHNALNMNNMSFEYQDIKEDVINVLEEEYQKYLKVRKENQVVIDALTEEIVRTLRKESAKMTDLEKCKFIFEYITKHIEFNKDAKKYNRDIPFGDDYDFEFYKGIPISTTFEGTLITTAGLSDDIANLMVFLGRELNIPIGIMKCTHNDDSYMINTYETDEYISYIDATSFINKEATIDQTCLVNRSTLLNNADYHGLRDEGIVQEMDFSKSYDFTNIEAVHERLALDIVYVENNIFSKK